MSNWSREELRDAVIAYKDIQRRIAVGSPLVKSEVYRELSERHGRTAKSFEYRMQNISYVLSLSGREWMDGLKPAKNVGTNVIRQIEEILAELEGRRASHNTMQRANDMAAIQSLKSAAPVGKLKPDKKEVQGTVYNRDSNVVAWVHTQAEGRCEQCDNKAPFQTADGIPFLEVHHVRHLADGGSDTISNAVALCPNCHRELHYSVDAKRKKEQLYSKVSRLIKE